MTWNRTSNSHCKEDFFLVFCYWQSFRGRPFGCAVSDQFWEGKTECAAVSCAKCTDPAGGEE
jgi:hypothetical protein